MSPSTPLTLNWFGIGLVLLVVPRGISEFYVSFKYYKARGGAQLNTHATSILRQMQSQHRDQEPTERHAQERKGCGQGRLPELRNLSLPNRKGIDPTSESVKTPLTYHFLF